MSSRPPAPAKDFEAAAKEGRKSFLSQYLGFLAATGKYWLVPVLLVLLALAALVMLGGTAAAPFIYTLF